MEILDTILRSFLIILTFFIMYNIFKWIFTGNMPKPFELIIALVTKKKVNTGIITIDTDKNFLTTVYSPDNATIVELLSETNTTVKKDTPVCIVKTSRNKLSIIAPATGTIEYLVAKNQQIAKNEPLFTIKPKT